VNGHNLILAAAAAAIACGVSLITSVAVASHAYVRRGEVAPAPTRDLAVTGSAKLRIRSDVATWSIVARSSGRTQEEAWASLEAAAAGIRGFLRDRGFPDEVCLPGPVSTSIDYVRDANGRDTQVIFAHRMTRHFDITTPDCDRVHAAAGAVTDLLRTGLQVESRPPSFLYTRLAELKVRMVGEATANARERGETIARGSGCRIGPVLDARAGVLQITAPWSTEVTSSGIHDTGTIEKDVTSVVHLRFEIVPQ